MSTITDNNQSVLGASLESEMKAVKRQARYIACEIRRAGCEPFAPDMHIGNERRVIAWYDEHKAFVALHRMHVGAPPVEMPDAKPDMWQAIRQADRAKISVMVGSEQEAGETLIQWARRMGLCPPWLQYVYRMEVVENPDGSADLTVVKDIEEAPDVDMQRHKRSRDDPAPVELTPRDVREELSWPEQREFRWNDPVGYAQWVADLKEEMGVHFDESLVLPEFRHGQTEEHPDVEDDEDLDNMYSYAPEEA